MFHHSAADGDDLRFEGLKQRHELVSQETCQFFIIPPVSHRLVVSLPQLRIFKLFQLDDFALLAVSPSDPRANRKGKQTLRSSSRSPEKLCAGETARVVVNAQRDGARPERPEIEISDVGNVRAKNQSCPFDYSRGADANGSDGILAGQRIGQTDELFPEILVVLWRCQFTRAHHPFPIPKDAAYFRSSDVYADDQHGKDLALDRKFYPMVSVVR